MTGSAQGEYWHGYDSAPIGGGNPYHACVGCGRADPEINGQISGHGEGCTEVARYRENLDRQNMQRELDALRQDRDAWRDQCKAEAAKVTAAVMQATEAFAQRDLHIRATQLLSDELTRISRAVTDAYDDAMPVRTGDVHAEGCACLRCAVDMARVYADAPIAAPDQTIADLKAKLEAAERERDEWKSDYKALSAAIVGDTGLSAMTVATQAKLFRPRAEAAEAALKEAVEIVGYAQRTMKRRAYNWAARMDAFTAKHGSQT